MSKTPWTPGPWEVRRAEYPVDGGYDYAIGASVIDGSDKQCIAETFFRVAEDEAAPAEANAHLIASAPELYEALDEHARFIRDLQDHVVGYLKPDGYDADELVNKIIYALDCPHQRALHERGRKALRKARGEDQ